MNILYLILTVVSFIFLILLSAMRPMYGKHSLYELERRSKLDDKDANRELVREKQLGDVISLQHTVVALLLVSVTVFSLLCFGWLIGIFAVILITLGLESMARFKPIRYLSKKMYNRLEKSILHFIDKHPNIIKLLRGSSRLNNATNFRIESREELQHLIAESGGVLDPDEKKLIIHSLAFNDKLIRTIMTPRDMVVSISKSDFLGPLMLNDLHKVGHSRLPVIDKDLDHIVGILNLKSLLMLDIKKSSTAEKAMEPKVCYVREDETLYQGFVAFSHTHQHLLVVINAAKETVGILVLKDIIEALLGRKIVDEFDDYDNIRAVASRK